MSLTCARLCGIWRQNQPVAGAKNFGTLVESLLPLFNRREDFEQIGAIFQGHMKAAFVQLNDVWRRKLGLREWRGDATQTLLSSLLRLMERTAADYTLTWRQLSHALEGECMGPLSGIFYKELSGADRADWTTWIEQWRALLVEQGQSPGDAAALMRATSPKYVPREWMLVNAYQAAQKGDFSVMRELYELFLHPYDEQPQFEAQYYRKAPALNVPGTSFMS